MLSEEITNSEEKGLTRNDEQVLTLMTFVKPGMLKSSGGPNSGDISNFSKSISSIPKNIVSLPVKELSAKHLTENYFLHNSAGGASNSNEHLVRSDHALFGFQEEQKESPASIADKGIDSSLQSEEESNSQREIDTCSCKAVLVADDNEFNLFTFQQLIKKY